MFHQITIVGNLGRDPELRYTAEGKAVCSLSVATSEKHGDGFKTTWFRVTAWEKTAEACAKFLSKGSKVFIQGRLHSAENGSPSVYPRKDGTFGASYEVSVDTIRFLSPKDETVQVDDDLADIPF